MSLRDVMSHAGLAFYAEVALVLFFVVFLGVAAWTLWPGRREELEEDRRIVLDDDGQGPAPEPGKEPRQGRGARA